MRNEVVIIHSLAKPVEHFRSADGYEWRIDEMLVGRNNQNTVTETSSDATGLTCTTLCYGKLVLNHRRYGMD
jgi:hypothetical protein